MKTNWPDTMNTKYFLPRGNFRQVTKGTGAVGKTVISARAVSDSGPATVSLGKAHPLSGPHLLTAAATKQGGGRDVHTDGF